MSRDADTLARCELRGPCRERTVELASRSHSRCTSTVAGAILVTARTRRQSRKNMFHDRTALVTGISSNPSPITSSVLSGMHGIADMKTSQRGCRLLPQTSERCEKQSWEHTMVGLGNREDSHFGLTAPPSSRVVVHAVLASESENRGEWGR